MEHITINRTKPIYTEQELTIKSMTELNGKLTIELGVKTNIAEGDKIRFRRSVLIESRGEVTKVCEKTVKVVKIINNTTFVVEVPHRDSYEVISCNNKRLAFREDLNIFAQDLVEHAYSGQVISDLKNGVKLGTLLMSEKPSLYHTEEKGVKPKDFLKTHTFYSDYGCNTDSGFTEGDEIHYIPNRLRTNEIYCTTSEDLTGTYIMFDQNEYYYRSNNGVCTLWKINERNSITISKEVGYWSVPISVGNNIDDTRLNQEELIKKDFVEDTVSKIIPDVIDMERVKYRPLVSDGKEASALVFNLHFRCREKENWSYSKGGDTWNNIASYTDINNTNAKVSDLLSDLNFIDTDVMYHKLKVSKSFIRLSFYDSNDPLTQKLLYYSTVFMDGGELFGKFMKRRTELLEEGGLGDDEDFVLKSCSADTENRVDSRITIYNEYNTTKCSEGFNIYLFADDIPLNNSEKTIYMKVEFNHAGYGRTIPMVVWPKGVPLTLDNYMDCLYIPIKLRYINNSYYYTIDVANNPCVIPEGRIINLNLFEPKLSRNGSN